MGAGYSIKAKADKAEVYLYEDVGEGWFGGVSAKQFADDLKSLGAVSQIDLRINSYGGEVFDGFAIYNQLKEHSAKVVSHVDGIAASIASVIAMAGDEILIAEAGFMMIHNAQGLAIGDARDMRQMADTLDTVTGSIADVYVARTGRGQGEVRDWMDDETWMTAADCVERGFADSMVENMRVAAHATMSDRHKFTKVPEQLVGRAPLKPGTVVLEAGEVLRPSGQIIQYPHAKNAQGILERMKARLTLAR